MIMNFKKTCEKNGISEFSRTRGGWMKLVEGIDTTKKGGYSFIGDNFFKVGNFDTNLPSGLYLDQSTTVVDGEKVLTMNLFKIHKGDVELLNTTPKTNGWAYKFWDDVESYFDTGNITSDDVVKEIFELTNDSTVIDEVIQKLTIKMMGEDRTYDFKNWWEVLSHLVDADVWHTPIHLLDKLPEPSSLIKVSEQGNYIWANKKNLRTYITKQLSLVAKDEDDCTIDENTPVDFKTVNARAITSEVFKNFLRCYETYFLVRTLPNMTGYHNRVQVIIYFYDDGEIFIRAFDYFVDPRARDTIPTDITGRDC